MKKIASRDNAIFKMLSKIEHSAKERKDCGKTILDGIHLVESCIAGGLEPDLVVVREDCTDKPEIQDILKERGGVSMTGTLFDRLSPVKRPTGIIALFCIPVSEPARQPEFCVFLDAIQDPGNMGAILRSAAAAGATDIHLSRACADPWSPKVLRSGMGAHFSLRIHEDQDLVDAMNHYQGEKIALDLDAGLSIYDLDLRGKTGFVIGNEGAGISEEVLGCSSVRAKIPMPGRIESLNAAQAAAICFFERVRQKA